MADLQKLVSQITFESLCSASKAFAARLIEEAEAVKLRRFVITAPRDNMISEAFKFSARHSEFLQVKAEALLQSDETNSIAQQYKVVVQYPDGSHTQSLLGVCPKASQQVFKLEQFIELMQSRGWTDASQIEIYIAEDLP